MSQELKDLHVRLPQELHRRLKIAALEDGRTMEAIVAELIARFLKEREAGKGT